MAGLTLPQPLIDLEEKRKLLLSQTKLGHEQGKGAKCKACKEACPGLELHYWRKRCLQCKCKEEDHDVPLDDSGTRFEILMNNGPVKRYYQKSAEVKISTKKDDPGAAALKAVLKIPVDSTCKLKWVPPDVSEQMVHEYVTSVIKTCPMYQDDDYRKTQMALQLPLQDVDSSFCSSLPLEHIESFKKHLDRMRRVVDQGKVRRVWTGTGQDENIDELLRPLHITIRHDPASVVKPLGTDGQPVTANHNQTAGREASRQLDEANANMPCDNSPAVIRVTEPSVQCVECAAQIEGGSLVVKADRAGPKLFWHPQCFKCTTCKGLLVDLVYFPYKMKVYCGRHYSKVRENPRCTACDELIFDQTYTQAEGLDFHNHHLTCINCDKPLHDCEYVKIKEDQPICLKCYELTQTKICAHCDLTISAFEPSFNYETHHVNFSVHVACYKCNKCKKPLENEKSLMTRNKLWCSKECATDNGNKV